MQRMLGFGATQDIEWIRQRLISRFGRPSPVRLRTPIAQLVKSSISGRTRDEVSLYAYHRLIGAYPDWSDIARAATADIEAAIGIVTFPEVKARYLRDALHAIAARRPDFDLTFLGAQGVARALEWLERLPGVGRKVSASTLNFSIANAGVRCGHACLEDFAPVRICSKQRRHANRLRCGNGDGL